MKSTYALRPESSDDLDFLLRLYVSIRDNEPGIRELPHLLRETLLAQQFAIQHAQYHSRWPDGSFSIVVLDGKPAGRCYTCRREAEIRLIDLSILPEFQGRGLGSSLVEDLQATAKNGDFPLRLSALRSNTGALRFYERLGFKPYRDDEMYRFLEWIPSTGKESA